MQKNHFYRKARLNSTCPGFNLSLISLTIKSRCCFFIYKVRQVQQPPKLTCL
uniref:Uncharacterized protein n=1 Tax=Anguilla anguilla TaxID=7936 RepID=A0A0E9T1N0_ANGAN